MEDDYVTVGNDELSMEFPLESDRTLTRSTVQSHFPNAIGLKYMTPSGAWRGLRAVDNIFDPPKSGWSDDVTYYISENEAQKMTTTTNHRESKAPLSTNFPVANPLLQDMAVFNLPWNTTDDELKQYFTKQCGGDASMVSYAEVKIDRKTGKSRGFGFVRFRTEEGAQCALEKDHYLGGRKLKWKREKPMKLFVGRLPQGTTKDELNDYFSKYGDLTDSYVPQPFRGFGFVTFASSEYGKFVINSEHIMNGVRLNVKKFFNNKKREASCCNNGNNGRRRDIGRTNNGGSGGQENVAGPQYELLDALRSLIVDHNPIFDFKHKVYSYLHSGDLL